MSRQEQPDVIVEDLNRMAHGHLTIVTQGDFVGPAELT